MSRRAFVLCGVTPGLCLTMAAAMAQGPGGAAIQGPPILRKAISASENLRYIGTRTVEFRRNGDTKQHTETITREGRRLRIDFPEGSPLAGQVIVENGFERRHYFPEKNEIHVSPPRREEVLGRLGRMMSHGNRFSFVVAAGQPVAGIRTEQVVVSDRAGNVLQRLYIDPESGLILKRSLFDPVGTPVGGFEYTRIDLDPRIDPRVFRLFRRGATFVTPFNLLERLAREHGFPAIALPASSMFRLEGSQVHKIEGNEVLIQNYASRDGVHLTLFQLKTNVSPDKMREFARKQNLHSLSWYAQGNTFVLIGNVDEATLNRIARPLMGGT
ncbi:LolA family protein [Fimbriimonas ginsengisoli]|uniref:Sigma E regulatory protein, MucB/RseB n=1 Tax=Fimbriimonas ginsengisoli Gsoil 348 TaxID=661478 RepID=A0A068NYG6_FIMGI|nr:hypothetical protein [Fimbriimonas ginsengisoli]AIE86954.1 hypothetical protein OP10G_3586 [Fimbriimonas ginsengisoli Gsoil 348]